MGRRTARSSCGGVGEGGESRQRELAVSRRGNFEVRMQRATSIGQLPDVAAVYALMGGQGHSIQVAYVGISDQLRRRIRQHLIRRNSSVTTGTSVVRLNPDLVTEVRWWEHDCFDDRHQLQAAEIVATDVLLPTLRSRGGIQDEAITHYNDELFRERMTVLFQGEPTGVLRILSLDNLADRVAILEAEVAELRRCIADGSD